jgi:hypothetical protein
LELSQNGAEIVGSVFTVDEKPVIGCGGAEFGGIGIGKAEPTTDEWRVSFK